MAIKIWAVCPHVVDHGWCTGSYINYSVIQ